MDERERAIEAAERTCPRCGAAREPDQRYCLECGLILPEVSGRLPSLRRRWIRRLGWYPGDWIWVSLLTLVVAGAGAASAIALTRHVNDAGPTFYRPPTAVTVTEPAPGTTAPVKAPGAKNGRFAWPRNENGWTIVLVSYPKTNGRPSALQTADKAARSGLNQVGVLDSSLYASLQPGYYVVFTGVYPAKADADTAVATARQAGFGGAYSRQIAR
jgi:ribosomal protein S27AE